MYMNQSQMHEATREAYRELLRVPENRLGIPEGHIFKIFEEGSDWEFITKLGVIIEAAASDALIASIGDERMRHHVSNLGQGNRVDLCVEMGILDVAERTLLGSFTKLRNSFAHRVANIGSTLVDYHAQLPPEERKGFDRTFGPVEFVPAEAMTLRDRIFYRVIQPLNSFGLKGNEGDQKKKFSEHIRDVFEHALMIDGQPVMLDGLPILVHSKHSRTEQAPANRK